MQTREIFNKKFLTKVQIFSNFGIEEKISVSLAILHFPFAFFQNLSLRISRTRVQIRAFEMF